MLFVFIVAMFFMLPSLPGKRDFNLNVRRIHSIITGKHAKQSCPQVHKFNPHWGPANIPPDKIVFIFEISLVHGYNIPKKL